MNTTEKQNIIINNEALIHKILRGMLSKNIFMNSYTYEDHFQTACLILMKQLDYYDASRGTISTFMYSVLPGKFRNLSLKHDKLERTYSVISSAYEVYNSGDGEDSENTIEDEKMIFEDDIDSIEHAILYNKLKEDLTKDQIRTYELCENVGPTEASRILGLYSNQCSRVQTMINFKLLSEYGYNLYYDDLKNIDRSILSPSDSKKIQGWEKFYSKRKDEPIRIALNSLTLYKKIFQQKYHIEYSKRLTA